LTCKEPGKSQLLERRHSTDTKTFHANTNQKKTGVSVLTPDRVDFGAKEVSGN